MPKVFTQSQLQAIANALGDTSEGLTGSEIGHLLSMNKMSDPSPEMTKHYRLYNAFAESQNARKDRLGVLAFIRKSMRPELYVRSPERYEFVRANLNRALLFAGLAVNASGELEEVEQVQTISEAQERAAQLRTDLEIRKIHPDVLRFCREELLVDDYFHAILEAAKSVADKLRNLSGLTDDGAALVDRALGGDSPIVAINALITESEKSEQRGFANLVKGTFGMFRNIPAHEPKVYWALNREDAEEVLTLLSMIHKKLAASRVTPRA